MTRFFGINEEDSSSPNTSNGPGGNNDPRQEESRITDSRRMMGEPKRGALTRMSSQVVATQLPNLDRQQHSNVFLLAMMEQFCNMKAREVLNKDRSPTEQLSKDDEEVTSLAEELYAKFSTQVGGSDDLPENLVGAEGSEVRSLYTAHFSHMLEKEAEKTLRGVESSASLADLRGTSVSAVNIASAIPRDMGHSLLMASSPGSNDLFGSTPKGLFGPNTSSYISSRSVYATEYEEIALLGKGGYGSVYKARNHLDGQLYAIKKIFITSQRLQRSRESDQIEALLAELRTLAKLQHTNIVRYYHGWIETSYNTGRNTQSRRPKLLEDLTSSSRLTQSEITDDSRFQELDFAIDDMTHGMDDDSLHQPLPNNDDDDDDGIIFGFSSSSHNYSSNSRKPRERRSSHATTTSSTTQKMSMLSVGEDDDPDVETIPRNFTSNDSPPPQRLHTSPLSPNRVPKTPQYLGPDITLCIKMSLHPTTLSNYLSPDPPKETELPLRHCFHQAMAIDILLSILDGVEYLHSQKIIHRDLKPANIFLSVHSTTRPSVHGCVDIRSCPECAHTRTASTVEERQHLWITPCIGDFGLIAEIKEDSSISPSTTETYKPSALSEIQPKPVGTQYYRPTTMPTKEPVICQKLDVYALGIIALELVYRFATRSERLKVLDALSKGVFPEELVRHDMAEGISKMVNADRDRRWGSEDVRNWLLDLKNKDV